MNHSTRFLSILALSLSIPLAYAHDPKEHAKEAAAAKAGPNCAAMKDMDHSKMDPSDPVMKAMMAKCGAAPDHAGMDRKSGDMKGMNHGTAGRPAGTAAAPHDHGSH
jgi:uncharacterized protein involved in copper resistance